MNQCPRLFLLSSSILFFLANVFFGQDSHPSVTPTKPPQPAPQSKIVELQNRRDIRSDAIFKNGGDSTTGTKIALPKAEPDGETAIFDQSRWHATEKISLAAREKKAFTVNLSAPSLVFAKISWSGASAPLQLTVMQGKKLVAEADGVTFSPGNGTASLHTTLPEGKFAVSVINVGGKPAQVNIAIASVEEARKPQ